MTLNATRPGRPHHKAVVLNGVYYKTITPQQFNAPIDMNRPAKNRTMRPGDGAGPYNSNPKTAAVLADRLLFDVVTDVVAGFKLGWNARRHMLHYLGNTGDDLEINLEDMIRSVPLARRAIVSKARQAQAFVQMLPVGRHYFTSVRNETAYNYEEESADWYFAIGGYTYWGRGFVDITPTKGSASGMRYEMTFFFCFYDRYNWDKGKKVFIQGREIADSRLGEFHRQGLAREYDCVGSVYRSFAWEGNTAEVPDAKITSKQGR